MVVSIYRSGLPPFSYYPLFPKRESTIIHKMYNPSIYKGSLTRKPSIMGKVPLYSFLSLLFCVDS